MGNPDAIIHIEEWTASLSENGGGNPAPARDPVHHEDDVSSHLGFRWGEERNPSFKGCDKTLSVDPLLSPTSSSTPSPTHQLFLGTPSPFSRKLTEATLTMEVDIDLQASEEAEKAARIDFRSKEFEATAVAWLGKPDNEAVSWDKDTGSTYSPYDTAFPLLRGRPHKVLAKLGYAANQLAAAERKGVEIGAKLQASREVGKPAQLTSPRHESDKPSNGSSVPVDLPFAPGNISAACGLPALVGGECVGPAFFSTRIR
jgi:hypothetical protein